MDNLEIALTETQGRIAALYNTICEHRLGDDPDSVQQRVGIVRELERLTKTNFKSTADLHFKIKTFVDKGHARGAGYQLKRARVRMQWNQKRLAQALECSQSLIAQMERDQTPLSKRAMEFVESANRSRFDKKLIIKQLQDTP